MGGGLRHMMNFAPAQYANILFMWGGIKQTTAPTPAQKWTVLTMGKWVPLGGSKNPVGWCCLHRFTLSVKQMKRKRCLVKDCRHFRKKKEHDYWKAKERAKQARKERKNNAT